MSAKLTDEQYRQRLMPAHEYIKLNCTSRTMGFRDIAKHAGMSAWHFHRTFIRVFGVTPQKLQDQLRIMEAQRMLIAGASPIDVAVSCGWAHQSHFTARFKQLVGLPPMAWLKSQKKAA